METTVAHVLNGRRTTEVTLPKYLLFALGGAGKASASSAMRQHQAAGAPFPIHAIGLDTDPEGLEAFDTAINLALTHESVHAMASNPRRYGPACQALVQYHRHLVGSETLGRGARTHRILTQVAFELFESRIVEGLRSAVHALLRQGPFARIQPVVLASGGGGTGSTATILLLDYLLNPKRKNQVMLGLSPDLMDKPVVFLIDAYAHALQQPNDIAPDWILSNVYAMRTELAKYEQDGVNYQYVFHLGLGNDAGAVFSTIEQVCEANGLSAWEWMANYVSFKSRAVDSLDFYAEMCRYQGDDVPERFFPKDEWPPYAAADRPVAEQGA